MVRAAEEVHHDYPFVSVERAHDLLDDAADILGTFSTGSERLGFVRAKLAAQYGPPETTNA